MTYFLKAFALVAIGGRNGSLGFFATLGTVAARNCRLHWLRSSLVDQGKA